MITHACVGYGCLVCQDAEDAAELARLAAKEAELARLRRRVATLEGRLARVLAVLNCNRREGLRGRVWSRARALGEGR